ncbi:hypothetical protein EPH_0001770 [Eimeria praecox]|uniref:Uncharacterized protein n=1 Tax=Eimeria praecox TaxID=51316 RepID=U6G1Q8_9EIME|nr:hypothetical protein EPH_0001770 [Eimeria praecox]
MHRQEAKEKQGAALGPVRNRQRRASGTSTTSRPRSSDATAQDAKKQKPGKASERRRTPFAPPKAEAALAGGAAKAEYAKGKPPTRSPVMHPWSTKPRPPGQPSRKRLKQLSVQERLQQSPTRGTADTGNNVEYFDGTPQASGEEEDAQPFNPLDEVLVLLRKLKRAENYSFNIPRNKRSAHKGIRNDVKKQQGIQAFSAVAESVCSNTNTSGLSGKTLTSLGHSEPEGEASHDHQRYEVAPSQCTLSRLKYLPLEAFDIPEEYGEASPEALLQRCRFECQQRRLKMRSCSKGSTGQTSSLHPASFESVNHICSADGCTPPASVHASACAPGEGAVTLQQLYQERHMMSCSPQKQGTHRERELVGEGTDQENASSHDSEPSDEQQPLPLADAAAIKDKSTREPPQSANDTDRSTTVFQNNIEGEAEAEVLHFVGNSWTHIPCVILRYDNEQRRFEVQLRDGTLKTVRRLALRFCFEPPQLQQQRIAACTNRRRQALTRQHFLNSVNGLPSSAFSPLPQSFINCIIKTATGIGRLRNRCVLMDSLRSAVQQLKSRFLEASKLSAVLYCAERLRVAGKLESSLMNYPFPQKQQQQMQVNEESQEGEEGKEQAPLLQVLQPMLPTPPPALGRLYIGVAGAFEAALAPLRKKPLFANNKTFRLSLLVEGTFCDLRGLSFFDLPSRKLHRISFARIFKKSAALKLAEWTIPEPDQFLIYQQALSSDVADALGELGRDSLCHALINAFGPLHTAATVTPYATANLPGIAGASTASSPVSNCVGAALPDVFLRRQLIRFNAMLRSKLLSFVIDSANEWKHYMLRAVEEKLDPDLQNAAASAPDAAVAAGFSLKGNVPCLLRLQIVISNDSAIFYPEPEKQVHRNLIPYFRFYRGWWFL